MLRVLGRWAQFLYTLLGFVAPPGFSLQCERATSHFLISYCRPTLMKNSKSRLDPYSSLVIFPRPDSGRSLPILSGWLAIVRLEDLFDRLCIAQYDLVSRFELFMVFTSCTISFLHDHYPPFSVPLPGIKEPLFYSGGCLAFRVFSGSEMME